MKENYCSVCRAPVVREDAPVLAISGTGIPRCLCDFCAEDIETASYGKELNDIAAAMDRLAANISGGNIDDPLTLRTMTGIMQRASDRAELIKSGEYDFALDEEPDGILDEIPEELLESEQDKALDAKDDERASKIDKVLNWVWLAFIILAVGYLAWMLFFR